MLIKKEVNGVPSLTPKQLELLQNAKKKPITFDEDSPELTEKDLKGFRRVNETIKHYL